MLNPPSISSLWNDLFAAAVGAVGWPLLAPVSLPADEGEHVYPMEWWYFTGHLTARRFGFERQISFEMTVFRLAEPLSGTALLYGGYFSRIDRDAGAYRGVQRFVPPWNFTPREGGFEVTFDDPNDGAPSAWSVRGEDDGTRARFEIKAGVEAETLSLTLESDRPAVLHGDDGLVDLGLGGGVRAAYYSRTRLDVTGQWDDGQDPRRWQLTGSAWQDHQWGVLLAIGRRWHFFAIQFDGSRELACYEVFDHRSGELLARGATWVHDDGAVTAVEATITVATRKTDPRGVYPLSFDVEVTLGFVFNGVDTLRLQVDAVFAEQVRNPTSVPGLASFEFWEGASDVVTTNGTNVVRGRAFVELGGYAPGSV